MSRPNDAPVRSHSAVGSAGHQPFRSEQCARPHRHRDARQWRPHQRGGPPARPRPPRVQDRQCRNVVPGVGQAQECAHDQARRGRDRRWHELSGQPRAGPQPRDLGGDPGRWRRASHGGGNVDHADRTQLLAKTRRFNRCGVQLHAIERRRSTDVELRPRVPPSGVASAPRRLDDPDPQRRRRRATVHRRTCRTSAVRGRDGSCSASAASRPTRVSA